MLHACMHACTHECKEGDLFSYGIHLFLKYCGQQNCLSLLIPEQSCWLVHAQRSVHGYCYWITLVVCKTNKQTHIILILFLKTDKRMGISRSCSVYIFLIAVQKQDGNGTERGRGLEAYCDIFLDKNDIIFRRDWRLWCLLVLCKLINVHSSGSSFYSICHRTRISCCMFSGDRAAALPRILF